MVTEVVKPITKNKRVSKHWEYDKNITVDEFNLDQINEKNLINHLLVIKQKDITYSTIMRLFGSFKGKKLCNHYDTFTVPKGGYRFRNEKDKEVSNTAPFITTIGLWIYNIFFFRGFNICHLVGGYVNESVNKKKFNATNQKLVYAIMEDKIDTETYKKYLNYTQFFMPFEDILSPNHTEAILTCTKYIEKKKQELIPKYQKDIESGNVSGIEKMEKELLDYAKELLKDDPALDLYESGAGGSFGNNFKNMYVMKGCIKDPDPNAKKQFNVALSNYADGISADEYSLLANSLSAGPYARGKKTEIGGYWEKLFGAGYQHLQLGEPESDCGTKQYLEVVLDDKNLNGFMYSYIVKNDGSLEELTSDNMDKYRGKKVKLRFSAFCKHPNGFCHKCAGNFFYRRGDVRNVGLVVIQIASKLKLISMKAFHDSTINTYEIDPIKAFNINK